MSNIGKSTLTHPFTRNEATRVDLFTDQYMDNLRDRLIATGDTKRTKGLIYDYSGDSIIDEQENVVIENVHDGRFIMAFSQSWARLSTQIGWVEATVEKDWSRACNVIMKNKLGEVYVLNLATMFGRNPVSITLKSTNGSITDKINGVETAHSSYGVLQRLLHWVNKSAPQPKEYDMGVAAENRRRYYQMKKNRRALERLGINTSQM